MKKSLLAAFVLSLLALPAAAQNYPTKPVTVISTSSAGSPGDTVIRVMREAMMASLGQPLVIENRDSAGGTVAVTSVIDAAPDGYTLLSTGAGPIVYNPFLMASVTYKVDDLKPVVLLTKLPTVLIVNSKLGVKTFQELVALAKSKPGELRVGSAGNGTPTHLAAEMMMQVTGTEVLHIPYRGTPAAATAVLSNEVDMVFSSYGNVAQYISGGEVVPLVVNDTAPVKAIPQLPTAADVGYPNFIVNGWFGLFVPKDTPDDTVAKIAAAAAAAAGDEKVVETLEKLGFTVASTTPDEFKAFVKDDIDRWGAVIKAAGIEPQ